MHCTTAFRPKVDGYVTARQVFWLARHLSPSHLKKAVDTMKGAYNRLTATGIAPDLHRIPY